LRKKKQLSDRELMMKAIEVQKKKIRTKAAARKFLVEVGIITPKGNFRKPYRHLKFWKPE
jgi:hypothetical protein